MHGAISIWSFEACKVDCSVHLLSNFSLIMAKCLWRTGSIWPVDWEFGRLAKYRLALVLYIYMLFLRVLSYSYMKNFFKLTIPLRCKLSTFSSNANFHYYGLPIIFNGAIFNQPLCLDLQLLYFRFLSNNITLTTFR